MSAASLSLGEARRLIEERAHDCSALARIAEHWELGRHHHPGELAAILWEHAEFCASTRDTAPRPNDDTGLTPPAL